MSREILFRGKDTIYQEWIYGNLLTRANYAQIWQDSDSGKFPASVIPETVSQFTGLYDKNGVRIWENDIVEYDNLFLNVQGRFEKGKTKSIVTFDNEHACFSPFEPDLFELYIQAENVEIIGNRFDNPELLKGK